MLRGPLHNRGADGLCEACRERFPCPDGVAIFESVVQPIAVEERDERCCFEGCDQPAAYRIVGQWPPATFEVRYACSAHQVPVRTALAQFRPEAGVPAITQVALKEL
jgi:hypothetical protein